MPMYDYKFLLQSDTAVTVDVMMTNEIDFGLTYPGVNKGGKFGMHVILTSTFTSLASGAIFWIMSSATSAIASTNYAAKHSGMYVPVADLVIGTHFFIPMGSGKMYQYNAGLFDAVTGSAVNGAFTAYFGDAEPPS